MFYPRVATRRTGPLYEEPLIEEQPLERLLELLDAYRAPVLEDIQRVTAQNHNEGLKA